MTNKRPKNRFDTDEIAPAARPSSSYAARIEEWFVDFAEVDLTNPNCRAAGYIRSIRKCGLTRQNGLAVVGVRIENKRAMLLNGRSCNDTACSVCSRKNGAKSTEETRRVITKAAADGYKIAFCVLSKASPRFDLKRDIESAKSKISEEKVWSKWGRHIGHSVLVAVRSRELLGNWLRSLPEDKRPFFGCFPEVVFPFEGRDDEKNLNLNHGHFHINYLWFFPPSMTGQEIYNFKSELFRRWSVSVKTAFTEEKDPEDKLSFGFEHYEKMVPVKYGEKNYTDEKGFYFKLLGGNETEVAHEIGDYCNKASFEGRDAEEDDNLTIYDRAKAKVDKEARDTAFEAASAVTKTSGRKSVNQFSLNDFCEVQDPWKKEWAAQTKKSWLRASAKKKINAEWSRLKGKRLPTAWGCHVVDTKSKAVEDSESFLAEVARNKTRSYYRDKTEEDLTDKFGRLSREEAIFYKKESTRTDVFLRAISVAKKRILQLERYRLAKWDWDKTLKDSRISKNGLESIKKNKRVSDFTDLQKKLLFRGEPWRAALAGKGLRQFLKAVLLAAYDFDKSEDRQRYLKLEGEFGISKKTSVFAIVSNEAGWPEAGRDKIEGLVSETLAEILDFESSQIKTK